MGTATENKALLMLTEDVMAKIDEHRGDLTRAEFVGLCVDSCLDLGDGESSGAFTQASVPVALWIPSTMSLNGLPYAEAQRAVGASTSYSGAQPSLVASATQTAPHQDSLALFDADLLGEETEPEDTATIVLWVFALLLFGFVDTLTTILIIARGGMEVNPFARALLGMPGGAWAFTAMKVVIIVCLILVSQFGFGKAKWAVPAIITIAGLVLSINNFGVLMRLH